MVSSYAPSDSMVLPSNSLNLVSGTVPVFCSLQYWCKCYTSPQCNNAPKYLITYLNSYVYLHLNCYRWIKLSSLKFCYIWEAGIVQPNSFLEILSCFSSSVKCKM